MGGHHGLAFVATGHTADDQAETVLHRLLRGTGVQGLRGIAERRRLTEGVEVVRPLLDVTRAEVVAYLGELGIQARQDSSNADLKYTRNRIRHHLLPLLEQQFNPAIRTVLTRLAEEASEVFAEEEEQARDLLTRAELPRAGTLLVFGLEVLRASSRRRVRQMFRLVWQREGWDAGEMRREHWNRLQEVVFDDLSAIDLPGRIRARRRESVVQVGRA
jgi:tRNA(Ile)-lysidine synthase